MWDDAGLRAALAATRLEGALTAYDRLVRPALKSDLGRYAVLFLHGGMYVDTDMECLRGFQHLLTQGPAADAGKARLLFNATIPAWLRGMWPPCNNCWMYFPRAGHPALRDLLTRAISILNLHPVNAVPVLMWVMSTTGPAALHRAAAPYHPAQVDYISSATLEPISGMNLHRDAVGDGARSAFPDAYAAHHPTVSWAASSRAGAKVVKALGRGVGCVHEFGLILVPVLGVLVVALAVLCGVGWAKVARGNSPRPPATGPPAR